MSDTDVSSGVFDVTIPITFDSSRIHVSTPAASIEKQMEREVEEVFREWDENVKCRKQSSLHIRPASASCADKRRRRADSGVGRSPRGGPRFEFPEIDVVRREDASLSSGGGETPEDDARGRFYYADSPVSGRRMFHVEFDVSGYDQENISVRVSGTRLVVHAIQHESDSGRKSTTEFCRKMKLPPDVNVAKLQCTCAGGKLVVEAPTAPGSTASGAGVPTFSLGSPTFEPLNRPVFRNGASGRHLHLTVELGRIFRADDVVVKVKRNDRLVIHAERREDADRSRMTATMTREYDLDEKIVPQSLKAGLTADGLLKVNAQVATGVQVIVNGLDSERESDRHDDNHS